MVFDAVSFILGGLVFGILAWFVQAYLGRVQLGQVKSELREAKQQLSGVKLEVERVRTQLTEKMALTSSLESSNTELTKRLPKLEGFERANADLRLQMQGFDNLKQKLGNAETELSILRQKAGEFDALQNRFEALQTEFSSLKTKTSGFEMIQAKAARTDELEQNIGAFELEKAEQLKIVQAALLKASDAEAAQQKLRASLQESVAEVARTRAGMQQFEGLKTRIDELEARGVSNETQAKLDGLETELSAYKARVAQLETAGNAELELARVKIQELEQAQQMVAEEIVPSAVEIESVETSLIQEPQNELAQNTEPTTDSTAS